MTIEADITNELNNYAPLSALVSDRNYYKRLPNNPVYPNTVLTRRDTEFPQTLGGRNKRTRGFFQIDIRGNGEDLNAVKQEVKAALENATGFLAILQGEQDLNYDNLLDIDRVLIDVDVKYDDI